MKLKRGNNWGKPDFSVKWTSYSIFNFSSIWNSRENKEVRLILTLSIFTRFSDRWKPGLLETLSSSRMQKKERAIKVAHFTFCSVPAALTRCVVSNSPFFAFGNAARDREVGPWIMHLDTDAWKPHQPWGRQGKPLFVSKCKEKLFAKFQCFLIKV